MQDWILIPMVLSGVLLIAMIAVLAVLARLANRSERASFYDRLTDIGIALGTVVLIVGVAFDLPTAVPAIGMAVAWITFIFWILMKLDQAVQRLRLKKAG